MSRKSLEKVQMGPIGYIILIIIIIAFIFPIFWLTTTSLKPKTEWITNPPIFIPNSATIANFLILFLTDPQLVREIGIPAYVFFDPAVKSIIDSAITAGLGTALAVIVGMLAAFGVSRHNFGGTNFLLLVLMLRMAPPVVAVIPLIIYFSLLNLSDTYLGLILVYATFSMPYAVWIIKSLVDEVPKELEESARLDGLSPLAAHFKVTLPIIKGGVLATALLLLIFNWSEYLFAVMLTRGSVITLPVQLTRYQTLVGSLYGPMAALALIAVIPLIIFGILIRKFLVRGLTFGAVKG